MLRELHILVGLPGCGKTTFAQQYQREFCDKRRDRPRSQQDILETIYIIDMDQYLDKERHYDWNKLKYSSYRNCDVVVYDGLFLCTDDIITILDLYKHIKSLRIILHKWEIDRDICMWNDRYRRDTGSDITIKNAEIQLDIKLLIDLYPEYTFSVVKHISEKAPEYIIFARKYQLTLTNDNNNIPRYLRSESWSLGGTWGSYNNRGTIHPDPAPSNFEKFDDILTLICPTIQYLQYKKLYIYCIDIHEYDDGDYYGGTEYRAYYRCNVEAFYKWLVEHKLFNSNEL
jgi:hypothetical protein